METNDNPRQNHKHMTVIHPLSHKRFNGVFSQVQLIPVIMQPDAVYNISFQNSLYFVVFRYSNLDSSYCRWTLFDLIYSIWKPVKWQTWRTKPRYVNIGQSALRFQASGVGHINAPLHSLTHWFLLGDKAIHLNASFFELIIRNSSLGTCCEIDLMSMPKSLTADLSILVQVMAWCRQATSHCLSQYWPRSVSPYGVTTAL